MDNSEKIILDLCGGTGSWSKPYKDAGYDVRVITLPEHDVFTYEPPENVYGIFAAPPCTMFSLARTTAKTPRDFRQGIRIVEACERIVRECRIKGSLKFWALENPVGYLRQFLGKPYLTYQPNEYGDNYTKKTDIWGYFKLPAKRKKELTSEEIAKCAINNRDLPQLPEGYSPPDGNKQAARRAMTSHGFARAFFQANQ